MNDKTTPDALLSTTQAADLLGVSRTSVLRWRDRWPALGVMHAGRFLIPRRNVDLLKAGVPIAQVASGQASASEPPQRAAATDMSVPDGFVEYALLDELPIEPTPDLARAADLHDCAARALLFSVAAAVHDASLSADKRVAVLCAIAGELRAVLAALGVGAEGLPDAVTQAGGVGRYAEITGITVQV